MEWRRKVGREVGEPELGIGYKVQTWESCCVVVFKTALDEIT